MISLKDIFHRRKRSVKMILAAIERERYVFTKQEMNAIIHSMNDLKEMIDLVERVGEDVLNSVGNKGTKEQKTCKHHWVAVEPGYTGETSKCTICGLYD